MARERKRNDETESSILDRRDYLRATGALAGSLGLGAVGERAAALTTDTPVDVVSVTVDESWKTVRLSDSYADPVALALTLSYRGPQPATARLRDVSDSTFEIAVEEWLYLDGNHRIETVGGLVTDPGRYTLADGVDLEVGRVRANNRWTSFTFSSSFSTTPIVFSQSQTVAGPQPIVTRHRNISQSGANVRIQEEEAQGPHRIEDVGYLAVEPGSGTLDARTFEAGICPDVGRAWETIEFDETYRQPVLLAATQTFRGANTCTVRYRNLTESTVEVKVEEERSVDRETFHLGERVGYLVVEGDKTERSEEKTPLSELDRGRVEKLVHQRINERRANRGLGSLDFDRELREIARYHSKDMAQNDYFSHDSPSGESMGDRYDKFGYDCRADAGGDQYYTGAENIARTYYDTNVTTDDGTVRYTNADELARGIVRGWMNSDGHRENILMDAWGNEGIGLYVTPDGAVYATQNFC